MQIDITRHIGAITRAIESREHEGQPARVLVATRTYDTDPEDLWDALTSAERIPRWFLPITGELRLGGRYQLEGNAGGEITRCDPPHHLALTWEFGGGVSWVEVRLSAAAEGTLLELEHIAHVGGDLWDQFGPGAVGVGWDLTLMGLDLHFSTGVANDPKLFAQWMATAEGREFVERSSEGWCLASIAAGTGEAAARAAADRTTAFYTGGG
jgi:uncharacterized protein YndB with AHSA1/START domain